MGLLKLRWSVGLVLAACIVPGTYATFHLMQIQQVIAGVNGDTTAQAIQLRMRSLGQQFVSEGRLVVYDATGANPIHLIDVPSNVANSAAGSTVLFTTASFNTKTGVTTVPDFTLTNPIPASYMAAGSLTWEEKSTGTVYWRISWGGASYTGSNAGSILNDDDGNFGPAWAGPVPHSGVKGLLFQGTAAAKSAKNSTDYTLSGPAAWKNNAGATFTIKPLLGDMNCDGAFDGADIDPFFAALGDPNAYAAAFPECVISNGDINGDQAVDGADIDPFFVLLGG
jgi:hypothetical protein